MPILMVISASCLHFSISIKVSEQDVYLLRDEPFNTVAYAFHFLLAGYRTIGVITKVQTSETYFSFV